MLTVNNKISKVLDTEVMSNFCHACTLNKKLTGDKMDDFLNEHAGNCQKNYSGTAGGMEPGGIIQIFRRSETKYNMHYVGYLGDGDSKSYKKVCESDNIYGGKPIEKLECCGHIQKRMYNLL